MKKLHILAALLVMISMVAGCTKKDGTAEKPQCVVGELLVVGVTPLIAKELQCTGTIAMRDDILRVVQNSKLCAPEASPTPVSALSFVPEAQALDFPIFGPGLCSFFGGLIVDTLVKKAVPETWGCSVQVARDKVKELVTGACSQINKSN